MQRVDGGYQPFTKTIQDIRRQFFLGFPMLDFKDASGWYDRKSAEFRNLVDLPGNLVSEKGDGSFRK